MWQDDWDPDWHATSSSKVAYLVNQLKVIQDNNLMQHYPSDTTSKTMPDELKSMIWQTSSRNLSTSSLPCKAIVFSQFLEHINVIEEQVGLLKILSLQSILFYLISDADIYVIA